VRVKLGSMGSRRTRRVVAAVTALVFAAGVSGCAPRWQSQLASTNAAGTDSANAASWGPVLSPDGTKVAFQSYASNLGPTDTNGVLDVYVRDLSTGITQLVSVNATGTDAGDDDSSSPSFSADGSKLLFDSHATNLTSTALSFPYNNLYLRDLAAGTTTLVSMNATGDGGGDADTHYGHFTPVGNKIQFMSEAHNLAPGSDASMQIFERDMTTGVTARLFDGSFAQYSPSGDAIAFMNGNEAWLRDTSTGAITLMSGGLPGTTTNGPLAFSPDGTKVAFQRRTNVSFLRTDIFVFDRVAGTTRLVTVGVGGSVSSNNHPTRIYGFHPTDSNRLLFSSRASNLVTNDTNADIEDVFVRNLATGVTSLVSTNGAGTGSAAHESRQARWVGDGSRVAFISRASDLGVTDTNGTADVYIRDMTTGTFSLVSANAAGDNSGNNTSGIHDFQQLGIFIYELSVSSDGSRVAFGSDAANLGPADSDRTFDHDIYVARLAPPPS
jgi:Tol biopolymer transport system component